RETGIANSLNPNLLGIRYIPKVLDEAVLEYKPSKNNASPNARLRLLALLNFFKKENNITNRRIDDSSNLQDYRILKTIARKTHDDMEEEIFKQLKKEKSQLFYLCESNLAQYGFPIQRCQDSWAASLLLFETHKHRSNRSRIKASVYSESSSNSNTNHLSDSQIDAISLREEKLTADYVNLYNGYDSNDTLDDEDLFGREHTPLSPALSPALFPACSSSPPPIPAPTIRKRVISRDEDEDMFDTPPAKPKRTRKTKQKK
ncbi:hypothetical protein BD770DRAFT_405329, partial [Pilaira anomala]